MAKNRDISHDTTPLTQVNQEHSQITLKLGQNTTDNRGTTTLTNNSQVNHISLEYQDNNRSHNNHLRDPQDHQRDPHKASSSNFISEGGKYLLSHDEYAEKNS